MSPLYAWSHRGDGAPTRPAREVYGLLEKELEALEGEWAKVIETDLLALNAKARALDLDFVSVPVGTRP